MRTVDEGEGMEMKSVVCCVVSNVLVFFCMHGLSYAAAVFQMVVVMM
jgi:hypothetical protein